jgi:hypothetical protein
VIILDRIVRAAGASLAESLDYYWPPSDIENMVAERNISLHMAHAFRAANNLVYGEVNSAHDGGACRYDLLAIDPERERYTVAEFKRLHSRESAEAFVADWARIVAFQRQPAATHAHPLLPGLEKWGLVAAITGHAEIGRWFSSNDPHVADPWTSNAALGPLDQAWANTWEQPFASGNLYFDAFPLADWDEAANDRHTLWLVYVFARL